MELFLERISNLDYITTEIELLKENLNVICHFTEDDNGANIKMTLDATYAVVFALERVWKALSDEVDELSKIKYTEVHGA